jgi:two-component system, OmpR family, response regulator
MQPRRLRMHSLEKSREPPWTVLVVAKNVDVGRALVQSILDPSLRFVVVAGEDIGTLRGGLSTFDGILLQDSHEGADRGLPRRILHEAGGAVVVLTQAQSGLERALWLDHGADDCLSTPVECKELSARLRASIRRRSRRTLSPSQTMRVGSLLISRGEQKAEIGGQPLTLTTCEFSLLAALADCAGQVLGRERLIEIVMGRADSAFERAIDVQVSRLRRKLRDNPRKPRLLKTVRGVGYMLVASEASSR